MTMLRAAVRLIVGTRNNSTICTTILANSHHEGRPEALECNVVVMLIARLQ